MKTEQVQDPAGYLKALGALHDVCVNRVALNTDDQSLTLVVDDINATSRAWLMIQAVDPAR